MSKGLGDLATLPVSRLKVTPKKLEGLTELGISSVLDLLLHYPRRHLDRTNQAAIGAAAVNEEVTVLARVRRVNSRRSRAGKFFLEADLFDGSGYLKLVFFNAVHYYRSLLAEGTEVAVFGRIEMSGGRRTMKHPVVDPVGDRTARIVPIYPQSEKQHLTTWDFGRWIDEALRRIDHLDDPVPGWVLDRFALVDRDTAMRSFHLPETMQEVNAARKRLVFDELLRIQLVLVRRKKELERTSKGIAHVLDGDLVGRFHRRLPFPLTRAQRDAIREIGDDMAKPVPMHRLLQGDVGSGKTLVAVSALLLAVQGGHQGALMAPTEVLAEQHYLGVRALLEGLTLADDNNLFGDRPVRVELLTNRTTAAERTRLMQSLADGDVDILIGTHALIQEKVAFRSLGVAVIDEQHRFGVEQRAALRGKGEGETVPDVLVMTATPIPRTAAMTVYGDLDVSVLDELPPGRTPVTTIWARGPLEEVEAWSRVRAEVEAGHQAYVVAPLIDESEKLEVRSAQETYDSLREGELAGLRLGLLHGRVPAKEKEVVMEAFRNGDIDVLVATTVIEVGVDVPNASVMVILDADRFGIAQLHQLRGRVGRGAAVSWCYLVGAGATPESEERLGALERSTDGFELAEVDLDLRGEGTIMGVHQKGRNDLRLASLRRDREWVARAREIAFELYDAGIPEHLVDELDLLLPEGDEEADAGAEFLFKS